MAQTVLLFKAGKEKDAAVRQVCKKLGIRVLTVAQKDYAQKLGALAGIDGFAREKIRYDGAELPAEMLVFSEMNSAQVDAFLAAYRQTGVPPVALKAVITSSNIFWNAGTLQRELLREHLFMTKK